MIALNYRRAAEMWLRHELQCLICTRAEHTSYLMPAAMCSKGRALVYQMQEFWMMENA